MYHIPSIKLNSPIELRLYWSLLDRQCSLQLHTTIRIPFGSPSVNWCSHCINTHCYFGLAQHYLLYVGQVCDSGCAVTFTSNKVTIKHCTATILTLTRDKDSGL
jgi:hypothetical protein